MLPGRLPGVLAAPCGLPCGAAERFGAGLPPLGADALRGAPWPAACLVGGLRLGGALCEVGLGACLTTCLRVTVPKR